MVVTSAASALRLALSGAPPTSPGPSDPCATTRSLPGHTGMLGCFRRLGKRPFRPVPPAPRRGPTGTTVSIRRLRVSIRTPAGGASARSRPSAVPAHTATRGACAGTRLAQGHAPGRKREAQDRAAGGRLEHDPDDGEDAPGARAVRPGEREGRTGGLRQGPVGEA